LNFIIFSKNENYWYTPKGISYAPPQTHYDNSANQRPGFTVPGRFPAFSLICGPLFPASPSGRAGTGAYRFRNRLGGEIPPGKLQILTQIKDTPFPG
jgi:hypothetical protein